MAGGWKLCLCSISGSTSKHVRKWGIVYKIYGLLVKNQKKEKRINFLHQFSHSVCKLLNRLPIYYIDKSFPFFNSYRKLWITGSPRLVLFHLAWSRFWVLWKNYTIIAIKVVDTVPPVKHAIKFFLWIKWKKDICTMQEHLCYCTMVTLDIRT